MHQPVKISPQVVKFIDTNFRVKNSLKPEERKNEIVEDKVISSLGSRG
jgi:hypothetical protein